MNQLYPILKSESLALLLVSVAFSFTGCFSKPQNHTDNMSQHSTEGSPSISYQARAVIKLRIEKFNFGGEINGDLHYFSKPREFDVSSFVHSEIRPMCTDVAPFLNASSPANAHMAGLPSSMTHIESGHQLTFYEKGFTAGFFANLAKDIPLEYYHPNEPYRFLGQAESYGSEIDVTLTLPTDINLTFKSERISPSSLSPEIAWQPSGSSDLILLEIYQSIPQIKRYCRIKDNGRAVLPSTALSDLNFSGEVPLKLTLQKISLQSFEALGYGSILLHTTLELPAIHLSVGN